MTSADVRIGRRNKAVIPAMALALACALSPLGNRSAEAQDTLYIGKDDPSVTVDMSVIDALGPAPRMPDIMLPITSQGPAIPARPGVAAPASARSPVTLRSPSAAKPKPSIQAAAKPAPAAAAKPAPAPAAKPAPVAKPTPAQAAKPAPTPPTPESVAAAPAKPAPQATSPAPPPPPAAAAPPPPPQAAPKAAPAPAPAPVPAVAPKPQPETKPQVASAPTAPAPKAPSPAASSAGTVQLLFGSGEADLTEDAKKILSGVAQTMRADDNARLQLMAFAAGAENEASMARRLSLSRALAVRSYLIAEGVRSTRIDVRALGNKTDATPADRVDLLIDPR